MKKKQLYLFILISVIFSCTHEEENQKIELPKVETVEAKEITTNSSAIYINLKNNGGDKITRLGVVVDTNEMPTINGQIKDAEKKALGKQKIILANLKSNTQYHARAFAINSKGVSYGKVLKIKTLERGLPKIETLEINDIRRTFAKVALLLKSNGNIQIKRQGIVMDTLPNPDLKKQVYETKSNDFEKQYVELKNLKSAKTYYLRAFAVNEMGTVYGEQKSFTTLKTYKKPSIETQKIVSISYTQITVEMQLKSSGGLEVLKQGVVIDTKANPDTTKTKVETPAHIFEKQTAEINNLQAETIYYLRTFAVNKMGISYGQELQVKTKIPTIATTNILEIANVGIRETSVIIHLEANGGAKVNKQGVVFSENPNPNLENAEVTEVNNELKTQPIELKNLKQHTKYYLRSFAINAKGTAYSKQKEFTTLKEIKLPSIEIFAAKNISNKSAEISIKLIANGGENIKNMGIAYAETTKPDTNKSVVKTNNYSIEKQVLNVSNLKEKTTYYARAFAVNSKGINYSQEITFTTEESVKLPSIEIFAAKNISNNSAKISLQLLSNGRDNITNMGIVYAESTNPDTNQNTIKTSNYSNEQQTLSLSGLKKNTTYYARAFAVNSKGISYSLEISFTTLAQDSDIIFVEGGTFIMGNNADRWATPEHQVQIPSFKIMKYEVTNKQYCDFLNANRNHPKFVWFIDIGKGNTEFENNMLQIELVNNVYRPKAGKEKHPVVGFWYPGALAYAEWVGGKLPSEAQFEYAARGGNKSKGYIYSGSNNLDEVAWYKDNSPCAANKNCSHPVGTKKANELGIHDMSGNVFEWCLDDWHENYNGAPTDGSAWMGNPWRLNSTVLRGGSWQSTSEQGDDYCRSKDRNFNNKRTVRLENIGFRVVFDVN